MVANQAIGPLFFHSSGKMAQSYIARRHQRHGEMANEQAPRGVAMGRSVQGSNGAKTRASWTAAACKEGGRSRDEDGGSAAEARSVALVHGGGRRVVDPPLYLGNDESTHADPGNFVGKPMRFWPNVPSLFEIISVISRPPPASTISPKCSVFSNIYRVGQILFNFD